MTRRRPAALGGTPTFHEPVFVTRALAPDRAVFERHLASIFERQWFTNDGPVARELEAALRVRLEAGFCAAFANGTLALQAALRSLALEGEVITTPFTFPATVHAIEWNGLAPVFCDVDSETYNLDPVHAAELVNERTSAVVPVHVFGNPCDVQAIQSLSARHDLRVVYDAAHAFGVRHRGRAIGAYGDLSVFSFHATKTFHTAEGGAVVGGDASLARDLRLLRNFGIVDEDHVEGVGINGKLSELHAALGLAMFERAEEEIRRRETLWSLYHDALKPLEGLRFQRIAEETQRNFYGLQIEVEAEAFGLTRDQLHAALRAENVMTRKYFHPLCSENASYRDLPSAAPERLPNAHRLAARILCLPLYGDLGAGGVEAIVDALARIRAHAPALRVV